jgi:hypothetical protein
MDGAPVGVWAGESEKHTSAAKAAVDFNGFYTGDKSPAYHPSIPGINPGLKALRIGFYSGG